MANTKAPRLLHTIVAMGVALTGDAALVASVANCGGAASAPVEGGADGSMGVPDGATSSGQDAPGDGEMDGAYASIGNYVADAGSANDTGGSADSAGTGDASEDADGGCYPCI
jgi:hypothetical protein